MKDREIRPEDCTPEERREYIERWQDENWGQLIRSLAQEFKSPN